MLFASSQLDVARSPRQVEAALREQPAGWLTVLFEEAGQADWELLQQLAPESSPRRFPRREEVKVRPAVQINSALLLPLDWRSSSPDAIFPAAELDLEAAPLEGAIGTRIELRARLTAPGGREPDPALLEGAQQYVRELTARICAHLLSHLVA